VCNESLDGWDDVTVCAPDEVCDATGPGRCAGVEAP
jgi:hypothetical protein